MRSLRAFKKKLSIISRLRKEEDYATALAEVESALNIWPGNARLHVLRAKLVQLTEDPIHDLDDAKQALMDAAQFDERSPAAAIELGYFLDNIKDDPHAASRVCSKAVVVARHLLVDGLIGQAKVLRQMDQREEFLRCLLEVLHLTRFEPGSKRAKAEDSGADIIFELPIGHFHAIQLKGPYAEQIQELLSDAVADRSA